MTERMTSKNTSNKRIAKNVFYLYVRLFLMLLIGLYTSRIILDSLGEADFGLYGVVGSLVYIFTFVSGALTSSASRFMAVELEVGDEKSQNRVFCMTLNIHILFSALIVLVAETIGLWYLYHKMVIPEGRLVASAIVYQLSCASAVFQILVIPYRAQIVANEQMKAFAYLSIFEVGAQLLTAFAIYYGGIDKLILYGFLTFGVQVAVNLSYYIYCRRHFIESRFKLLWDRSMFKKMLTFTGWSATGYLSWSVVNQCYNLLLNLFFGPVVNAARAIAYQVQTKITQFATNFQAALNPQIVKNYAAKDVRRVEGLVIMSMKISFSLMLVMMFPILTNIEGILSVWLVKVPENTGVFVVLVCITQVFGSMGNPFGVVAEAANKIRKRILTILPVNLLALPISYLCLLKGQPAVSVFIVALVTNFIVLWVEFLIARSILGEKMHDTWVLLLKCTGSLCVFAGMGIFLQMKFDSSILSIIACGTICLVLAALWVLFFILNNNERNLMYKKALSVISKK